MNSRNELPWITIFTFYITIIAVYGGVICSAQWNDIPQRVVYNNKLTNIQNRFFPWYWNTQIPTCNSGDRQGVESILTHRYWQVAMQLFINKGRVDECWEIDLSIRSTISRELIQGTRALRIVKFHYLTAMRLFVLYRNSRDLTARLTLKCCEFLWNMMTSSNGNIFRVTGSLCGEFTGHRWISPTKPVTRRFDVFFDLRPNKRLSKQPWGWWFEMPQSWVGISFGMFTVYVVIMHRGNHKIIKNETGIT